MCVPARALATGWVQRSGERGGESASMNSDLSDIGWRSNGVTSTSVAIVTHRVPENLHMHTQTIYTCAIMVPLYVHVHALYILL